MAHIYMSQGERAGIEGFSLLAEDHVPGGISAAALLTYYDFKELADCDAWLAHYLADEDGFALAVACKGYAPPHLRTSAPPHLRTSAPPHPRTSAPPHLRTSGPPRLRISAGAIVSRCVARSTHRPR